MLERFGFKKTESTGTWTKWQRRGVFITSLRRPEFRFGAYWGRQEGVTLMLGHTTWTLNSV